MTRKLLILGAGGVVGRAALEHFEAFADWEFIAASRRAPDTACWTHISLDFTERRACEAHPVQLSQVTHVIYAALYEKPGLFQGWHEQHQMQTKERETCLTPLLR